MPQREENKREYFKKITKEMGQPKRDPNWNKPKPAPKLSPDTPIIQDDWKPPETK
jgi:hypothetical protein